MRDIEERKLGPLPEILHQPVIPPPLHGVNPRIIMGGSKWDILRREVYKKYGLTCAACGVSPEHAFPKKHLEAHERFQIDYKNREMTLIDMEPLCPACHQFVHSGLLTIRFKKGQISTAMTRRILQHGLDILAASTGQIQADAEFLCRTLKVKHDLPLARPSEKFGWSGWKMVWNGISYPSPYPTQQDWENAMRTRR
jgi:hypothetical protein